MYVPINIIIIFIYLPINIVHSLFDLIFISTKFDILSNTLSCEQKLYSGEQYLLFNIIL
jgi:hypothetical protein